MLIYINTPSGRTTGVSLRPSDTVANLKVVKAIHPAGCDASHDVYTAAVIINLYIPLS